MSATTPATSPYLLLGGSQRAALQDALAGRLTRWRQRWSTATCAIAVHVPESITTGWTQFTHGSGLLFSAISGDATLLHAHVTAGFLPALLGLECRAHETVMTSQDLTGELRSEVLRSMCGAVLQGMNADPTNFEFDPGTQPARFDAAHKHRALPVSVAFAATGNRCTLVLHPRLVELLAPRRRVSVEERLSRRHAAIATEALQVQAVLGEVELSFGELRSLSGGDVIVLDKSLSDPAQLITETGARVSAVALGSAGTKRAVRVVAS